MENTESVKRAEQMLLHYAKLAGHAQPRQELQDGMHSLVNNLLIDLLHLCGKEMFDEQLNEAVGHFEAETKA